MTVTIHTGASSHDLLGLIRDLQILDGGASHRVRRAVHGSGAIVEDDLALAWLMLTTAPTPEFLESLIRQDPRLEDLVGRRASDAALHELYLYLNEVEAAETDEVSVLNSNGDEVLSVQLDSSLPQSPGRKATKAAWAEWAQAAGLVDADQAETMTKAQLQELDDPNFATSGQSAPEETEEG
jgi:hypothetical protein